MSTKPQPLYLISMAAELLDMHPQTLRKYERLGLVRPPRTLGSMRVYRDDELQRLLSIAEVAQRIRPLVANAHQAGRSEARRLADEVDELFRLLGLDEGRD